jgi:hypothetical protein
MLVVLTFVLSLSLHSSSFWLQLVFPYTVLPTFRHSTHPHYPVPSTALMLLRWVVLTNCFTLWRHFRYAGTSVLLRTRTLYEKERTVNSGWKIESSRNVCCFYQNIKFFMFLGVNEKDKSRLRKLLFYSGNIYMNEITAQAVVSSEQTTTSISHQ